MPLASSDAYLADAESRAVLSFGGRLRVLVFAGVGSVVTCYATVAAIFALVTAVATKAHFTTIGVLAAGVPGWLAAHQVPLTIGAQELGALPLLPTIGLIFLIARTAGGAAERLDCYSPRHALPVVLTLAGAHGGVGLTLALVSQTSPVTADPLASLCYPALLAGLAALVGAVRRCGLASAVVDRVDAAAVAGLRVGLFAMALLLLAGAVLFTASLIGSFGTARDLFAQTAPGAGNGTGAWLLSAAYLPNGVVAASSFVAGPGFGLGAVEVSSLHFTGGPVPALPLLAALPEQYAAWWPVLCLVPLGIGALVGWLLREIDEEPRTRLRAVGVAAVVVAVCCVVVAGSAGGRLGRGPLDPLTMRAAMLSMVMVGWIVVVGGIVTWWRGPHPVHEGPVGLIDIGEDEAAPAETEAEETEEPAESEPAPEPDDEPDGRPVE